MSIRMRITLAIAACLLLACGCISAVVYTLAREAAKDSFHSLSLSELRRIEERVHAFLEPGERTVRYLAETELLKNSRGELTSYLDTEEVTTLWYENHPPYEQALYNEFMSMHNSNENFGLVFMANTDGQYAQAPEGSIKTAHYDPRLRSWWSEVMEKAYEDEVVVSSPYLTTGGGMVCSIMTKTFDDTGRLLGMVGVDYSLESLTGDLSMRQILKTGYIVVFDESGSIMVDGRHPEYVQMEPAMYPTVRKNMAQAAEGDLYAYGSNGTRQYIVTYDMPSTGWRLAVVFEEAEMMSSSYALLRAILLTSAVVFAVALVIGIVIAKGIVFPIEELTEAATMISSGEHERSGEKYTLLMEKLNVTGQGESRKLAGSLKLLVETLQMRIEAAQAAARTKSEFLSNMSHEIRTPINAITGMTMIGQRADTITQKDYAFDKIESASRHLLSVINDVLDMSKIEAGKAELASAPFCLGKVAETAVDINRFRIEEKKHSFTLRIDPSIPMVLVGDDRRLSQVIANLLSNAVKFTPEGGAIALEAALLSERDGNCEIRISVADNGIGISEEQQAYLFEAFRQAESSTSRKYGGTGLGLSISRYFTELMGGHMWVESEPGKGSTFFFTVFFLRGGAQADMHVESADENTPAEEDFRGFRILLAEDVEINKEIVLALLEPTGVSITCAADGMQAVQLYENDPDGYDLVFMDIQMPIIDGLEATRRIRALNKGKSSVIPIIAMTANAFKEDADECLAAGMNAHIGKPIQFDLVMDMLRRYLTRGDA